MATRDETDTHEVERDGTQGGRDPGPRLQIASKRRSGEHEPCNDKRNVQRPRVFYRREIEAQPLVVAKSN